jgi:hypothetical protein
MGRCVRITVRGKLSPRLAGAFEGLAVVQHNERADLVGEIADQAELYGHLNRIRDLGLELENLSVLPESNTASSPTDRT